MPPVLFMPLLVTCVVATGWSQTYYGSLSLLH